ncbi:MAG: phosphoadenosine phosphosulfate reductase [Euryarchaeota archaeon]|nr:phosphoadenosine phosphosulfate reductase [Euryarchaeota archaeon]
MKQKNEKIQVSGSKERKAQRVPSGVYKTRASKVNDSFRESPDPKRASDPGSAGKKDSQRFEYEDNYIYWCGKCNLPLIGEGCGRCGGKGETIRLSQPADVRFCSPHEREVLDSRLCSSFGGNPLGDRLILLNKIPGEDKTDEVIVDGFIFGILRFELSIMDYNFEPSVQGAKILLKHGLGRKVELKKASKHLNGKNVGLELIESFDNNIKANEFVLVTAANLTGYGISLIDGKDFSKTKTSHEIAAKILKIRKIDSSEVSLHSEIPDIKVCVEANKKHLQMLGKNAINTIRGIVSRNEHKELPVYVSFSGGKDSLVVLDLARAALKQRELKAFFLNTGIEFPETVEFVRIYCLENKVPLQEVNSGTAFWEQVEKFGPPAKDFRWCCKVCKLASAGELEAKKEIGSLSIAYLTIDGKRKHESFSRARIAATETNPFVPSQLNIFPIRDWKALEVWLYIYWRGLSYNPLYDLGFERVGCWLCPSALAAEYLRVKELHPDMYDKWDSFLLEWAKNNGFSAEFIKHGFWRWKELPPKMLRLAEELGISTLAKDKIEDFEIEVVGGISPCKAGGFSIEAGVRGIREKEALNLLTVLGNTVYAEELGLLMVKTKKGTIKLFSNGNLLVNSETKGEAVNLFTETVKQFLRLSRCTGCGICVKTCPVGAAALEGKRPYVKENCTGCGKCTDSCVVTRYFNKFVPDLDKKLRI